MRYTLGTDVFGTKIWTAGSGRCLVFNTNNANVNVYCADTRRVDLTGDNYTTIRPLGSYAFTGEEDVYAVAESGTVVVEVTKATSTTPAPSDIALQLASSGLAKDSTVTGVKTTLGTPAQDGSVTALPGGIASAGVPLINNAGQVFSISQTLASGASYYSGYFNLKQPSYRLIITLQNTAAGTTPFTTLKLYWQNSAGTAIIDQQNYYLANGNGGANTYVAHGPVRGSTLQIGLSNNESTSVNVVCVVEQVSLLTHWHDVKTLDYALNYDCAGYTIAAHSEDAKVLSYNTGLLLTGTTSYLMPFYCGQISFLGSTSSLTSDAVFAFVGALSGTTYWSKPTDSGGYITEYFSLPREVCKIQIFNNNASAETMRWSLIMQDY